MNARSFRLLVVDDHSESRQLLARYMAQHDFVVREAEGAAAALALLRSEPFDLVLLDLMMPELDGHDLLFMIRQTHSKETLPIIIVTAKDTLGEMYDSLNLGANDFVTKPVELVTLLARVRAHLRLAVAEA